MNILQQTQALLILDIESFIVVLQWFKDGLCLCYCHDTEGLFQAVDIFCNPSRILLFITLYPPESRSNNWCVIHGVFHFWRCQGFYSSIEFFICFFLDYLFMNITVIYHLSTTRDDDGGGVSLIKKTKKNTKKVTESFHIFIHFVTIYPPDSRSNDWLPLYLG